MNKTTQTSLARAIGVSQSTVSQWASGKIRITPERAVAIAKELGVKPSEILPEFNWE